MKIKKFCAKTASEALFMVKEEFGPDAVILKTEQKKTGGLSLGNSKRVEVTAAIDESNFHKPVYEPARAVAAAKSPLSSYGRNAASAAPPVPEQTAEEFVKYDFRNNCENISKETGEAAESAVSSSVPYAINDKQLTSDIREMKEAVKVLMDRAKYGRMPSMPRALSEVYLRLLGEEVDETFVKNLTHSLYAKYGPDNLSDKNFLFEKAAAKIEESIKTASTLKARSGSPSVIAMIGPTGVGKTTTIAKLAAECKFGRDMKVALISADNYRIAAAEQLSMYGEITGLETTVVFSPSEIKTALRKYSSHDIVFIDTAGRSQRNAGRMFELSETIEAACPDEVHLVLSATTKESDLRRIIDIYTDLRITSLLFAKTDETYCLGPVFNVSRDSGIPLSFLGTGQNVPDDIKKADASEIAGEITGKGKLW